MHARVSFDRPLAGVRVCRDQISTDRQVDEPVKWLTGVRERMQQESEQHAAIVAIADGVQRAFGQVEAMVQDNLRSVTAIATELGLAIAQQVVGTAVVEGLFDPSDIVERCLRDSVQGGQRAEMRVELSPEDLNPVLNQFESDLDLKSQVGEVDFVANPALDRGSVIVSSPSGQLMYDPLEVLQRMCDEVRNGVGSR